MALLSNAGSFPPIKFSYFENEFGSNPTRSIGAYRVSETIDGLTVPTIGWTKFGSAPIPNSGPIKFSDFYRKMLITVVDLHSGGATTRQNIRNTYNADNVRVVGGFRSRPSDTGEDSGVGCVRGKYVIARVNKTIGSVKADNDKSKVALRTGSWDANTELEINIGSSGSIYGAGGNGGNGGFNCNGNNNAPNNATSALGIEYFSGNATKVINGGRIQCGYGGGGGGGAGACNPDKTTNDPTQTGSGGGGGAGYPNGSGGGGANPGNNSTNNVKGTGGAGASDGCAFGGKGGDGGDSTVAAQNGSNGGETDRGYGEACEKVGGSSGYNGDAIRVISGSGSYSVSGNSPLGNVVTGSSVS